MFIDRSEPSTQCRYLMHYLHDSECSVLHVTSLTRRLPTSVQWTILRWGANTFKNKVLKVKSMNFSIKNGFPDNKIPLDDSLPPQPTSICLPPADLHIDFRCNSFNHNSKQLFKLASNTGLLVEEVDHLWHTPIMAW